MWGRGEKLNIERNDSQSGVGDSVKRFQNFFFFFFPPVFRLMWHPVVVDCDTLTSPSPS